MADHYGYAGLLPVALLLIVCLYPVMFAMPVSAADVEIDAEMGDIVTISGVSYVSDTMYLFLTGPGLPSNGVMLTSPTRRADQGEFNTVDVASDQTWSFRWDTSRVSSYLDPGTYTVYATSEPVDKAHLGGSGSYKTVDVWLKDPDIPKGSSGAKASYTLNPEKLSSKSTVVPTLVFTSATPSPTPETVMTTVPPAPQTTATTAPTKAALLPVTSLLAVLVCMAFVLLRKRTGNGK
ncbi:MAG: hypothetical protein OS112_06665 [Methanoregula sp.]|nr:MAG: hypothetical protein OS112_06665 [Methanoregula sp.]